MKHREMCCNNCQQMDALNIISAGRKTQQQAVNTGAVSINNTRLYIFFTNRSFITAFECNKGKMLLPVTGRCEHQSHRHNTSHTHSHHVAASAEYLGQSTASVLHSGTTYLQNCMGLVMLSLLKYLSPKVSPNFRFSKNSLEPVHPSLF